MIFFTKFKHVILLLKQCKVEKEDDQLILAILSKLGADYSVFVSTFRARKLTSLGWKMHSLNAFIESLTSEHDKEYIKNIYVKFEVCYNYHLKYISINLSGLMRCNNSLGWLNI